MSHFDWHAVACEPEVVELGAVLREALGVWVGFLSRDGRVIPVGDQQVELVKPPCEIIRANALDRADGSTASCLESVQKWAERAASEGTFRTDCHAGLCARVRAVETPSEEYVGAVYVSGYLDAERADGQRAALHELLESNELLEAVGAEALGQIPMIEEGEPDLLTVVADRLAKIVRQRLTEPDSDGEELSTGDPPRFEGMIGTTSRMQEIFEDVATVADSNSTVLIEGENGTGKELVARALHRRSGRSNHEFVALNCAAVPSELIESELFGHKEGAFSGAHRDREGLCVEADRGTLFLDEIGDMARSLQSKLLRFLQDGRFTPVGANRARSVDVRVICATNQNLEEMVEDGRFRKDLYFRIHVVQLRVPPLRERRADIPLLIDHFLYKAAKRHGRQPPTLTEECREQLRTYDWPGNVRELENEVERLVIMAGDDEEIGVEELSPKIEGRPRPDALPSLEGMTIPEATEQLERKMILDGLRETGWNKTRAAEKLGVSRRNLIRKVSEYELEQYRDDE